MAKKENNSKSFNKKNSKDSFVKKEKNNFNKKELQMKFPRVAEAPFDSARKMMSTVHKTEKGYLQFTKGAPDVIINKCDFYLEEGKLHPMTKEYEERIRKCKSDSDLQRLKREQVIEVNKNKDIFKKT